LGVGEIVVRGVVGAAGGTTVGIGTKFPGVKIFIPPERKKNAAAVPPMTRVAINPASTNRMVFGFFLLVAAAFDISVFTAGLTTAGVYDFSSGAGIASLTAPEAGTGDATGVNGF
jgi:hypothetical protein